VPQPVAAVDRGDAQPGVGLARLPVGGGRGAAAALGAPRARVAVAVGILRDDEHPPDAAVAPVLARAAQPALLEVARELLQIVVVHHVPAVVDGGEHDLGGGRAVARILVDAGRRAAVGAVPAGPPRPAGRVVAALAAAAVAGRAPQIVAEAPQGLLRVGAVAGAVAADVLVPAGADDVDEEVRDRPAVALVPLDHAVVGGRAGRVDLPAEAGAGHPVVVVDVGHRVERLPEVLLALGDVAGAADLEQEARCLEQRDGVVRA